MKKNKRLYKFVEWSSPGELHEATLDWTSELEFIKDEQQFLNELIKEHTLQLISQEIYLHSQAVVVELSKEEKRVVSLLKKVKKHSNRLEIFLDGVNQLEEEKIYKKDHYTLKMEVSGFCDNYKNTKREIFRLIKQIMKQKKQKRLSI